MTLTEQVVAAYRGDETVPEACARLGVSQSHFYRLLGRAGVKRTRNTKRIPEGLWPLLRSMYLDGETIQAIADWFELSRSAVQRALVAAGTPMRRPGGAGWRGEQ